jgi:hypothetical protein
MSQTQPPENVIEIPEAASLKITAKTDESRIRGSAERLAWWTRVPGQDPMPLEKALALVRAKGARIDTWAIPGLDMDAANNDASMGRSTPATEAVAAAYRQFYGVAVPPSTPSATTETAVDTRVKQPPAAPTSTPTPSATTETATDTRVTQPAAAKEKKKNNLKPKPYAKDNIDRWSRLTGYELDSLSDYTRDQLRALASKYGIKRYSSYKDKNELAEVIKNTVAYQQAAPKIVEKKVEKVNLPKPAEQPSTIKIPQAHYIQGQRGRWEPEFENDIDHAVYFAGKSPIPKGDKQKEVLTWLKSLGLTYEQIHDHREKVLEKMQDTIAVPGAEEQYPYVYIDAVDQDFVIEDEEDEEEEDESEYDDLYGSSVDDLISSVQVEEEPSADDQEVNAQATVATQVLTEAEDANEQEIDESILDDFPEELRNSLTGFINKRTGKTSPTTEKKSTSNYVSNNKIFKFLTNNIFKIQGQLDSINKSIQNQTELIRANLELTASVHENLNIQNDLLARKLDAILEAIDGQKGLAKKFADDEENRLAEARLESGMDVAGTETATDTRNGKKSSGNSLLRRLIKFFGRKLASKLWKTLVPKAIRSRLRLARRALGRVKRIPSRLASKLASKIAPKVVQKTAQNVAKTVSTRAVAKGFEHIALPGVTKAAQQADAPAAKAITKSGNIFQRAFASPVIQKALVKTLGEEGAKKLTVKLAAKLLPIAGTAYGLGEGLARIAMGDVKGGFLSFGSAIPVGGVAFAAVDILRDINTDAYTRHIESNLPTPSDQNFAAFFADALGVTEDQYETGGETNSSKTVMLHGTELLSTPQSQQAGGTQAVDPIGGTIVATTTKFVNSLGPAGASVAPMFEQVAAPLAKVYDIPSVLVQTNIGGAFPSMQATLSKVKEKRKISPEEELSGMEKDLLETQDPQSFADKLLKMLDPEGKFQQLLQQINHTNPVGETGEGMATFGESGIDKGTGHNAKGWVHGHFQNSNKQSLVSDTLEVVKKLINSGVSTVVTATNKDLTKDMSEDELRRHIESGVDGHKKYGSGVYAIDVSVPTGTKVPYELENVFDSKGPGGIVGTMKGRTTQVMHLAPGSKAGAAPGTTQVSPGAAPTGDFDVIIPLDHVKPGNEQKIPDKKGGNTFENARATGAAGRERDHQDKAAAKVRAKLEAKGLRVKVITPEDFGNYEDYDKYITAQASKNVRIVPLHFDAAVGQGGTGFLTRTKKGDSGDAALAKPIQQKLSSFQQANPSLGNLGPTDTVSNATINRASASPAALVEMGSMVAWEKQYGSNFTSTNKFNELATGIAEGVYQGGGFNTNMRPPTQRQPAQSKYYLKQGGDKKADTQIVMIPAASSAGKSIEKNATVEGQRFTYNSNYNAFQTQEIPSTTRTLLLRRLGLN